MPSKDTLSPTSTSETSDELPYCVELWQAEHRRSIERVLGRAATAQLAGAIFRAAKDEHPERRITVRRGDRIISDSLPE